MPINTEKELEERLSRPTEADVAATAALDGDLIILGAGGKMGPSLARLARRAADQAGVQKKTIDIASFTHWEVPSQLASGGNEDLQCDLPGSGQVNPLPDAG